MDDAAKAEPMTKQEHIHAIVSDAITDVLYYDRKEDSEIPVGAIEEAIVNNEVALDDLVQIVRGVLTKSVEDWRSENDGG